MHLVLWFARPLSSPLSLCWWELHLAWLDSEGVLIHRKEPNCLTMVESYCSCTFQGLRQKYYHILSLIKQTLSSVCTEVFHWPLYWDFYSWSLLLWCSSLEQVLRKSAMLCKHHSTHCLLRWAMAHQLLLFIIMISCYLLANRWPGVLGRIFRWATIWNCESCCYRCCAIDFCCIKV